MSPKDTMERFRQYRALAKSLNPTSHEHRAIDTITLSLLNGDQETFRQYRQVAEEEGSNGRQLALDTLNMALLDRWL